MKSILLILGAVSVVGAYLTFNSQDSVGDSVTLTQVEGQPDSNSVDVATEPTTTPGIAIFAGGCFWCVESDFEKLEGVSEAISGYTGGDLLNPSYKQVTYEETGHFEAAQIFFDPTIVSYRTLVDYFFRTIDPLDDGGQFCDRGSSYKTAIFVSSPDQRADAEAAKEEAEQILGEEIVTPILDAKKFWIAESYHQDYYKRNPIRYRYYRTGCRRDARLAELWGNPKK